MGHFSTQGRIQFIYMYICVNSGDGEVISFSFVQVRSRQSKCEWLSSSMRLTYDLKLKGLKFIPKEQTGAACDAQSFM